ncbi:MAG: hypothetical protein AABY46_01040 [Nitrospirota bacterium]
MPNVGALVRLVKLTHVASPLMRSYIGHTGTVVENSSQNTFLTAVKFGDTFSTFWLYNDEWEYITEEEQIG